MFLLRLIRKNLWRHKLRTFLTIAGIMIAVIALGLMRTVITAWNAGVEASNPNRLIVVHSVSFIFPLPLAYKQQIEKIEGIRKVSWANWFSGIYIDETHFFARLAVDPDGFFDTYPEFVVSDEAKKALVATRNGAVIGRRIAQDYDLSVGDVMPMEGDIYPGHWEMQVVGIYTGKHEGIDETQMLFNWHYLNESLTQTQPTRAGNVGWYLVDIANAEDRTKVSVAIDALFANSPAETKTQTEKEFQQSFVSMSSAILSSINAVSFVIIGIILLVLTNTMIMTSRERTREYAVLRSMGFSDRHLAGLIGGEALLIAVIGGGVGLAVTYPLSVVIHKGLPSGWFPIFSVEPETAVLAAASALAAGLFAAVVPMARVLRMKIVDGLRKVV